MSMRLQLLIDEADYRQLERIARRHSLSLVEWVRPPPPSWRP